MAKKLSSFNKYLQRGEFFIGSRQVEFFIDNRWYDSLVNFNSEEEVRI